MKNVYTLMVSILLLGNYVIGQNCNDRYQTDAFDSVTVSTVKFGEAINKDGQLQELFMDIYQPYQDTSSMRPVLLFAFGGSFITGNRKSDELVYFATEMAKKGYVCASYDYRLGAIADLGQEQGLVKTVFRAVQDGKAAVRYFRKDADTHNQYRINPATIITGGTSAGAILSHHVAFVESADQLSVQWQTWLDEVGGLEGSSGSEGYCSKSNGVFSFSGGVADTSWIKETSVPVYSVHSTQDGIVLYNYGRPIGGNAPIELYGSGLIHPRMENVGVHNVLDTYEDDTHPSFQVNGNTQETFRRLDSTEKHLTEFLHNILPCNENNLLHPDQDQCASFTVGIAEITSEGVHVIYPNPAQNSIAVSGITGEKFRIMDSKGAVVMDGYYRGDNINVEELKPGIYQLMIKDLGLRFLKQ